VGSRHWVFRVGSTPLRADPGCSAGDKGTLGSTLNGFQW
jgi:hypothetical protein